MQIISGFWQYWKPIIQIVNGVYDYDYHVYKTKNFEIVSIANEF